MKSHWEPKRHAWPNMHLEGDPLLGGELSSPDRSEGLTEPALIPKNQKARNESKDSHQYPSYETLLLNRGVVMDVSELGTTDASVDLCRKLIETVHPTPKNTIFGDKSFSDACRRLRGKNKPRIIQDIGRLLVPSAETLELLGYKRSCHLAESVNEVWDNCFRVTGNLPQPDYAVGFSRSSFSDEQYDKLEYCDGYPASFQSFTATDHVIFPFLTCEGVCGTSGLDIADRRNAHTMAIAVRAIVSLSRLVKKDMDLHREILTFSISHNHRSVRIYGYYPIFNGPGLKIHRHPIDAFDFTARNGKERWKTFMFTIGVYIYARNHLKKLRSFIDALPPPPQTE